MGVGRLFAAALTLLFCGPAFAADPIKIGWLPSLTGPLAATPTVMDRGVRQAVKDLNANGGIGGRPIELVTRDTAGDPTKAISAVKQVMFQEGAQILIGPLNSGEALASVPVIAGAKRLNLVMGALEELINKDKYPNAFRMFPTNRQFFEGGTNFALDTLKAKKLAVVSDTAGYGVFSAKQVEEILAERGVKPVVSLLIDPNRTDLSDEVSKLRASGAEVVMPWGASTGMFARLINGTRDIGWNVPIVGAAALSATPILRLLNKPEYWEEVYAVGFSSATRDEKGQIRPATKALMDEAAAAGEREFDYTFWWYAIGYDMVRVAAAAFEKAGSTDVDKLRAAMQDMTAYDGAFATYSWNASNHDGYPQSEIVVLKASTFSRGLFDKAGALPAR